MSRAFVKEDVDLPERSGRKRSASGLPPGATNYITARGAKRLRDERSHVLPQRIQESGLTGKPIETLIDHIEFDEGRDPVAERAWEKI